MVLLEKINWQPPEVAAEQHELMRKRSASLTGFGLW